ncbi:hypothetical protein OG407_34415 [Streptomyces sp. NBC_01515]|uniref:hypothetical protein n=1 Tax=Streptomyces sp. NBC_01515 TaxID=2903890 RepID=UPI00386D1809
MEPAVVTGIAVLGTLLGSALTYYFQKRQAVYIHGMTARERLRVERIGAYGALAESVADLRGGQLIRWTTRRESPADSDEYARARSDSWRLRAAARSTMYRVQLVTDDEDFARRARELVELTIQILDATDADDLAIRAQRSAEETDSFINEARQRLSRGDTG